MRKNEPSYKTQHASDKCHVGTNMTVTETLQSTRHDKKGLALNQNGGSLIRTSLPSNPT